MTTVQALRELLKALGGSGASITDVMTIPEAILEVSKQAAKIKGLPAATTDGQVLTVSSGTWVSAAIPSQLPAVSAPGDVGKVLKVDAEGHWAAGTDAIGEA